MWDSILSALGGYAILTAALTFLTKSIVNQWLSKSVETYKADLLHQHSLEIEKFRQGLQIVTSQEISKRVSLQQRQVDKGSHLCSILHDVMSLTDFFLSLPDLSKSNIRPLVDDYYKKYEALGECYYSCFLYFPDTLTALIDSIRKPLIEVAAYIKIQSIGGAEYCRDYEAAVEKWKKERDDLQTNFAMIVRQMQEIIGVNQDK